MAASLEIPFNSDEMSSFGDMLLAEDVSDLFDTGATGALKIDIPSSNAGAGATQPSAVDPAHAFDSATIEPINYAFMNGDMSALDNVAQSFDHLDSFMSSLDEFAAATPHAQVAPANTLHVHITPRPLLKGASASFLSPHAKSASNTPRMEAVVPTMNIGVLDLGRSASDASTISASSAASKHAICQVDGCDRRVRSKGFCKTHGGGRKCSIPGCRKSSQNGEFCIGHGGGKKCKEAGCAKAAQSHGLCKAHGGGARCKYPNCMKSSQGGGLCRAHGGGKRCQAEGCPKGAQRGNFCATHGGFRSCQVDGCVRTDRGGGYCEVHRRDKLCKVKGCKKLSKNHGLCTMHIREDKREAVPTMPMAMLHPMAAHLSTPNDLLLM